MSKLVLVLCLIWSVANAATASENDLTIKIVYVPTGIESAATITPELFDKGWMRQFSDSVYVSCDSIISELVNNIKTLKVSQANSRYSSRVKPYTMNVRGKVILLNDEQVVQVYYLSQFRAFYDDTIYDIDERLVKNINSAIRNAGGKELMWE